MPEIASIPPLTKLSEEEELFRDTVRGFAERDIRPRVAAMEKAGAVDPALLAKCFELGLMGIEIPEQHGGAARRPGCSSSSPTPTSRRGTRASRRSRWSVAARALRSASGRTSSGFEPPPPAS